MQGGQRRRRDKNSDTVTQRKSNPSAGSSLTRLVTSLTRLSNQPVVVGHGPYSVLNNLVPV